MNGDQQYMVFKVMQLPGGRLVEAVQSQGTNVVFGKAEADEVFAAESLVLRASVTLEMRGVGDLVQRRWAQFIDEQP